MKKILLCLLFVSMLALCACGAEQEASPEQAAEEEAAVSGETEAGFEENATGEAEAGESAPEETALEETAAAEDTTGEAGVAPGPSAGGLVFMIPATDELLAPYDDFDVFNYNPGVQPLLFYTEQDIPDFRLVSVTMENDGGTLTFAPDQLLYQRNWLNPERPSLIQILPQGDINSGFGVMFTDPEDPETEHFYILSPTGRGEPGDPPLLFTEIY